MKRIVWKKQEALDRMLEGDIVYYFAPKDEFVPVQTKTEYFRRNEDGKMIKMNRVYRKSEGEYIMLLTTQDLKLRDRHSEFYSTLVSKGSVFANEIENNPSMKTVGEY